MFRLEFGKLDQRFESFVEVRIKETSSRTADGRAIANGPYVAVYVFEPEANVKHFSFNVTFDELRNYAGMVTYSIQEWYGIWIRRLLRKRDGSTANKFRTTV